MPAPGNVGGQSDSKYSQFDESAAPAPWIGDVDMANNWFSPFQPIWPFGPPYVNTPREWDYPVGYNLNFIPQRLALMQMLRGMRASWGVLATVVETRKDQLLRIPYTFQRKDKPRQSSVAVKEIQSFFRKPDGKLFYSQWARKLMDDLLVIDAPTIYFAKDRRGRPLAAEVIDGAMVFPLIDDAGRRPDAISEITGLRQPAFQQIVKGMPMIDLDESEIMYVPMRPRADLPIFGYAPTEQILIESTEAIRKTFYQADFWLSGNIPDLMVTVPDQWGPRQIGMFQAHFDALLSGNLALKSKVRFIPGGMKPFDIKNANGESLWSQRDETLIRLVCYGYSVSPTPFIKQTNRATAQNAQQTAEEEGLYPLMSYWKDVIIDPIIQEKFGYDEIEFVFLPTPEPDAEKQSKIHDLQIKNGSRSRNEIRNELGLEPEPGGDVATIEIGNAVIPVEEAAAGNAMPILGGMGQAGGEGGKVPSGVKPQDAQNTPQRGAPTDNNKPKPSANPTHSTPIQKLLEILAKATPEQLAVAASEATGHLNDYSQSRLNSGNYKKGHVWIQGLNISIENKKGSLRGEKDKNGKKWEVKMPTAYGYIRGHIGADGDNIDVYLGRNPDSDKVWVIDQNKVNPKGKNQGFDEHKVMLGYDDLKTALSDYLQSHFDGLGHDRCRRVTELSMKEFKSWLNNGDLKRPIAKQDVGERVLGKKDDARDFAKGDTISASTGLSWYDQTTATPRRRKRKKNLKMGSRWKQLSEEVIS